ncbi:hypothetical protein Salat_2980900 [Sesamum alatum]|uniref:Uncharacterized protein n=1 Tax=Sesamum alatum TaxID=300844 RepID=A0AAE2C7W6_9LAMI|nr:hypothetical protein Salat_2980900 [Sesamum alatum]
MAGGFFRIKSVLGRPGKTDWIERRCLCLFFIDRIPIIFSRRRRRQGRGCTYPRIPVEKAKRASAQRLMKSQQLVRRAYVLHSLPLNDEARSGRRDLNPQPQPWQGYALPLSYFRQRGKVKERSTTEQFTYHNIRMTSVFPPDHSLDLRSSYEHDSTSLLSMLGTGRFLSHSFSPLGWPLPATRTIDVTDQPHSSGQQLCSAFSADCQPVQLTSEDSSHPAQHLSSRRRLQSLSQGQATPEDQQPSPVASLPVASSDSGSLSQPPPTPGFSSPRNPNLSLIALSISRSVNPDSAIANSPGVRSVGWASVELFDGVAKGDLRTTPSPQLQDSGPALSSDGISTDNAGGWTPSRRIHGHLCYLPFFTEEEGSQRRSYHLPSVRASRLRPGDIAPSPSPETRKSKQKCLAAVAPLSLSLYLVFVLVVEDY